MKTNRFNLLFLLFLTGCTTLIQPREEVIFVSIPPLRYVVGQIVDTTTTRIEVFVPETSSPESYEPTVLQIRRLADASGYVSTGLIDFEQVLAGQIGEVAPKTPMLDLSEHLSATATDHHHGEGAADPHVWLSPRRIDSIGREVARFLGELRPDSAQLYRERAERFSKRIDTLDRYIRSVVSGSVRNEFAIGHTSLTYFADDYGLRQIAIEEHGKEPSVRQMKLLADSLRALGVKAVLYQRQTSDAAARAIARELPDGQAVEFDPLAENWMKNMYRLADTLHVILNE